MIKEELEMEELTEYFWIDSKVVLEHIANNSKAFKTFIAMQQTGYKQFTNTAVQNNGVISHQKTIQLMTILEVWYLKVFLTSLGGFRIQFSYGNHNQVARGLQIKKQIKMLRLILNGKSR